LQSGPHADFAEGPILTRMRHSATWRKLSKFRSYLLEAATD
jgi:hypothetical protein